LIVAIARHKNNLIKWRHSMTLDRPVTIVTGATSGIGAAIAETLCQKGHAVVIVGRSLQAGAALEDRLKTAGGSALFLAEDLSDRTAPDRIAATTQTFGGQIDALVNNAGLLRNGTAPETSDDDWDAVLDLNLSAAFRMSRAVLPQMQAQGQGSILNVASDWAPMGARGAVAPAVSKAALAQMSRCNALDHEQEGIRVNAICPTDTDTPMLDLASSDGDRASKIARLAATIPMGRVARVKEVAAVAAFLLSNEAGFITGSLIPVDGGTSAQ
jgi:NAD(P)-dependent dehydrogenase (short-subunit alcohol dehydrogenase family)